MQYVIESDMLSMKGVALKVELSIGNVVVIGLSAFLFIPGFLLGCKYVSQTNVPVASDLAKGAVNIWRAAA